MSDLENLDQERAALRATLGKNFTRRDAMKASMWGLGLTALGPIDRAAAAAALRSTGTTQGTQENFVVVIDLAGGNDGLNMVVPHHLGNYATQRAGIGLDPSETLGLDSGPFSNSNFRLHPRMDRLAAMYALGELGIVQKVGYPSRNGSHFTSEDIWASGMRTGVGSTSQRNSGWIGRYAAQFAPTPLGAVSVGRGRPKVFSGATTKPLAMGSLAGFTFETDFRYRASHEKRLELVRDVLANNATSGASAETRQALDLGHAFSDRLTDAVDNYTPTATYDNGNPLSRYLLDVARMLNAGFETRIFYTGHGGFDTHSAQGKLFGRHPDLLQRVDDAIDAFAIDMKALGIWDKCVIVVTSEFGRRNFENGSGGTDHGGANFVMVSGGAAQGGFFGPDMTTADLDENFLPYEVDFRSVFKEVLTTHLAVSDVSTIFAEEQEKNVTLGIV